MALPEARIHRGRPTPFPWERQALDFIYRHSSMSDTDPHQAWELHELYDPASGRLYEIDLLFLSRHGLFLVEIKSFPGELSGDIVDWTITENGRRRTIECPYPGANLKAKVLAELLERQLGPERPYVHAAVFLSNVSGVRLEGGRPPWLLLREEAGSKLVNGLDGRDARRIVNRPMMKQLLQVAHRIGLRPSTQSRVVGGYQLGALLDEGEGYQEHLAKNAVVKTDQARVRSYLVPAATSTERRSQLHRAAKREAQTLAQIGQHPSILAYRTFVDDAPLGPAVLFEAFEDALPLHAFLRQEPNLTFDERLGVLQQIVEAVAHCHRAQVLHRNLSPASVLVRRGSDGRIHVRLHRFQSAAWIEHSSVGTRHFHQLSQDLDRLYQAPEVLTDPVKATYESDVFSVGCLAWLLLTDQHPAATLAERERRIQGRSEDKDGEGGLRPSILRADLAVLDEAIAATTAPNLHKRPDDIAVWFDTYVLDALTRPTPPPEAHLDPRDAQKGDTLPGGMRVERRLGSGGTALVLHVRREGRDYALKVPHDARCGDRLLDEAKTLRELRHEHIVALRDVLTFGGLPCLLLEFAGERSLGDVLREQGTLPLELARRYGDDLLSAVQYLEEAGITHRDIKPTNVGFTSLSKKQSHLLLLDFSLSSADPTVTTAGTAEWRDPWLYLRGAWDAAADRYAAAAVLYHALTAARPTQGEASAEIAVEAERFDAAVRDRLTAFFRKAFAGETKRRFQSAEAMRQEWGRALSIEAETDDGASALAIEQVRPETPVDALPLSARARNALDRAGVSTVAELLLLPRNQLSVVRGVGTHVAREIVGLADVLHARVEVQSEAALVPGFSRPRLVLEEPEAGIEAGAAMRLVAAGINTTLDAALAPSVRIEKLLGKPGAEALRERLLALAAAEPMPGSLGDWARELIGRASQNEAIKRLRVLVGMDPLPDERPDTGLAAARAVSEVAGAFGLDPAQIHSSLQFLRSKRWAENPAAIALTEAVGLALDTLAPAASFLELAEALAKARTDGAPSDEEVRMAAALVRVALELRLRPSAPATWRRIGSTPWVAREPEVLDAIAALAETADTLAMTEPLPSSEVVRSRLAEVVEGTPLATLPADQRLTLAAAASTNAAASARLELYPRGMDAKRALALSLAALSGGGITPEAVKKRVASRYPEAAPLPERPALDALLIPHGLIFMPEVGAGEYVRPGQHLHTSMTVFVPPRKPTAVGLPQRRSPEAQRAAAFQDQLDRGVAAGRFRVVQVRADFASHAIDALARVLKTQAISLDHALVAAIRERAEALGVEWVNVENADRAGPEGPDWPLLTELVRQATERLVDELLKRRVEILVLVWPGALARYGLASALQRIVDGAERGEAPAILLVVPSHADGTAPSINGRLPVPVPLPSQRLVMPYEWLRNDHNAAETI
ncbi:protein kinase [Steroidobacter flavus]|uniref:Protein kinase n=1 Tax=Steroidobacter flavus TaxID=1842136 RepID=A0ABV8SZX1_9GAMM